MQKNPRQILPLGAYSEAGRTTLYMGQEVIEVGCIEWKDYSLGHKYSRLPYRTLQMVCPPWLQIAASYQRVSVLCAFSTARTASSTQVNFLARSWA